MEDYLGRASRTLWRGHGLVGRPQGREGVGGALGARDDWEDDAADDLLALAPGAGIMLTRPGGAGPGPPASFSVPPGVVAIAKPAIGNTLD